MNKTLYRPEDDKMIGGVCSGLGRYFDIDPTIIRLGFALLFFGFGTGILLYLLLWIVMPSETALQARQNMAAPPAAKEDVVSGEVVEKEE
ncbi:MAG: PspC domain-containing protein [Anaerolineae bacterium]|nr:PspC domain-containing protein [Anaerolineae bacterium]MBT7188927.1 PspC domain-containing protein [Anaerolineae bacterium]MBT7988578.1 PspC domain-containing protein [Anaerolineae bacterium]